MAGWERLRQVVLTRKSGHEHAKPRVSARSASWLKEMECAGESAGYLAMSMAHHTATVRITAKQILSA